MKIKPLTVAQRQAARRKRIKERGYQIVPVLAHRQDAKRVREFAKRLVDLREIAR